jgi:hypothetical protein
MSRKIISQDGWYLFGMESLQTIKKDIVAGVTSNDNSHNFLNDHIIANHTADVDSAYIVKKHNPLRCWIKGNNYWDGTVNVESNLTTSEVTYQWFYDDEIITDATSSNFTLANFSYGSTSVTSASYDPTKLSVAVKNSNGDKAVSAAAYVIIVGTSRDGIQKTTDSPAEEQWDKSWTNEVNGVLTAYYTFDDSSSTITYQWEKYDGSAYNIITGATDDMYALVRADVGSKIRCKVTKTPSPSGSADDYSSNDYIFIGPSNSPFNASDWAPVIYSGQGATSGLTSNDEILDYGNTTWINNTEMNVGIWVKVINHADTIPPVINTGGTVEAIESNFVKRQSGDSVEKDNEVLTDYYAVENEDATSKEFQLYSKTALTGVAAGLARSRLGAGGSGSNLTLSRDVAKDNLLIGNDGVSKYNYYVVAAANANANFEVYVKEPVSDTVIRSLFTSASRDITATGSVVARTIKPVYNQVIKIPLTKNIASINKGTVSDGSGSVPAGLYADFTITITDARSYSTKGDKFPSATRTTYPKNIDSDGSDLILTLDTYTPLGDDVVLRGKITNGPFIFNEGGTSGVKDNVTVSYTKNTSEIKDSADNALKTFSDTTAITVTNNCNRDNISPVVDGTPFVVTGNYTTGTKVRITFNVDITTETTTTNNLGDLDVNDFLIAYQDKRSPVQRGVYEDDANSINKLWNYVSTSNTGAGPANCETEGAKESNGWTGNSFCVKPVSATILTGSKIIELTLPNSHEIYGKTDLADHNVHVKYTNNADANSIIDKSEFKNRVNTFTKTNITNDINIYNTYPVFDNTTSPISATTKADSNKTETSIGTISKKTNERGVTFELVEYERDNTTIASFFAASPTYAALPSAKVVDDADMHFTKTGTNSLNILLTKEPNFIFGTYLTSTVKQSKGDKNNVGDYTVLNDAGIGEPFEVASTASPSTVLTGDPLKNAAEEGLNWSLNKYWNVTPPSGNVEHKFSKTIKHVGGVTNNHTYYFLVKMTSKSHDGSSPTDLLTYSPMMKFTPTKPDGHKKLYHQTESLVAANIAMYNGNFVWYYDRYEGDVAIGPWANGVGNSGWATATGSYGAAYAGFGVVNTQFAERFNTFVAGQSHSADNLAKINFKGSLATYSTAKVGESRIERGRGPGSATRGFEPGGNFNRNTLSTYIGVEDSSNNFFLQLNTSTGNYGYHIFNIPNYNHRLKHGSTVTANDDASSDEFNYLKYSTNISPANQQFLGGAGGGGVISSSNAPSDFTATENGSIKTAIDGPLSSNPTDPHTGTPQIYIFNVGRDKDIDIS